MATQIHHDNTIQQGETKTTWGQKNKWRHKNNKAAHLQHDHKNSVVACSLNKAYTERTQNLYKAYTEHAQRVHRAGTEH